MESFSCFVSWGLLSFSDLFCFCFWKAKTGKAKGQKPTTSKGKNDLKEIIFNPPEGTEEYDGYMVAIENHRHHKGCYQLFVEFEWHHPESGMVHKEQYWQSDFRKIQKDLKDMEDDSHLMILYGQELGNRCPPGLASKIAEAVGRDKYELFKEAPIPKPRQMTKPRTPVSERQIFEEVTDTCGDKHEKAFRTFDFHTETWGYLFNKGQKLHAASKCTTCTIILGDERGEGRCKVTAKNPAHVCKKFVLGKSDCAISYCTPCWGRKVQDNATPDREKGTRRLTRGAAAGVSKKLFSA